VGNLSPESFRRVQVTFNPVSHVKPSSESHSDVAFQHGIEAELRVIECEFPGKNQNVAQFYSEVGKPNQFGPETPALAQELCSNRDQKIMYGHELSETFVFTSAIAQYLIYLRVQGNAAYPVKRVSSCVQGAEVGKFKEYFYNNAGMVVE